MRTAALPYSRATSGDKALQEMSKILTRFGCSRFGTMTDNEVGELIVQFTHRGRDVSVRASFRGYAAALARSRSSRPPTQKDLDQARVSVCSCVRDWVKGQLTAVETGILTFEGAFLGQILLGNGRSVLEHVTESKVLQIGLEAAQ